MKKCFAGMLVCCMAATGFAATLSQDTQEVIVNGNFDPNTAYDSHYDLSLGYGYFIMDYLETGARLSWSDDDFIQSGGIGGFAEYNFDQGTEVVPFVGLSLDYINSQIDVYDSDESALVLGTTAGVKFFIAENIAISAQGVFKQATGDVYADKDGTTDNDVRLELGMRFFIGP